MDLTSRSRSLSALAFAGIAVAVFALRPLLPADVKELGAWCVLPCVLTVLWTFLTRRVIESVTLGLLTGCSLCHAAPTQALTAFSKSLTGAIMSEDIAWLFIVCGLMGGLISLVSRSGGARAFGDWTARHAKSGQSALLWAWALGCVIFIDDYLNSMTVGSSMARVTDRYRVPTPHAARDAGLRGRLHGGAALRARAVHDLGGVCRAAAGFQRLDGARRQ